MERKLLITLLMVIGFNALAAEDKIQIQSGMIDFDKGGLFYEVAGDGKPLILLHDSLTHREIWDEQFLTFAEHFKVIRYDRRGFGRSPKPDSNYSSSDDLLQVFKALKIGSAGLIGLSGGGYLAIDFTIAHPERVDSLILVGAVVSGFRSSEHMRNRGGHDVADYNSPESIWQYYAYKDPYIIAPQKIEARIRYARLLESNPQNVNLENRRFEQYPREAAIGLLKKIKIPTLIMVGELDLPDIHAHAGALNVGIANSRRMVITGSGHMIPIEQPKIFNQLVLDFLQSK